MDLSKYTALMFPLTAPEDNAGGGGSDNGGGDDKSAGTNGADDHAAGDQKKPEQKTNDSSDDGSDSSKRRTSGDGQDWERKNAAILADLKKERKARQEFETRFKTLESSLESERKRVRALAGVDGNDEDKELAGYRDRIYSLVPHLKKLDEAKIDQLLELLQNADGIKQTANHVWQAHSRSMVNLAVKEVGEALGGDLSDRQKGTLAREFFAVVQSDPELIERYEAGDETLAKEVAKILIDDWVTPARRNHTANEVNRFRKVPSGRDRNTPVNGGGGKKVNWSDPKAVEDAMVASFKEHGGEFGTN